MEYKEENIDEIVYGNRRFVIIEKIGNKSSSMKNKYDLIRRRKFKEFWVSQINGFLKHSRENNQPTNEENNIN